MVKWLRTLAIAALLAGTCGAVALAAQHGGQPGEFDYYALALSWSPTYCEAAKHDSRDAQCDGTRSFAFVLHGVWPQYNRGWPQDCRTRERPWVPEPVIQTMLDIMPSRQLIIHEYKKHGTCAGLAPDAYFATARRLFTQITIPERFRQLHEPLVISPDDVETEFLQANPSLKPDMISVVCNGSRLTELRICFSRDEKLQTCGDNEAQSKLCASPKVVLPPVR